MSVVISFRPSEPRALTSTRPVFRRLALNAEEIALHVGVAQARIEQRQVGKGRVDEISVQRPEHLRDRSKVVDSSSQKEGRQHEVVGAHVLPEVIEWAVIKDSVRAANERMPVAAQIVRETESRRPIITVRIVKLTRFQGQDK